MNKKKNWNYYHSINSDYINNSFLLFHNLPATARRVISYENNKIKWTAWFVFWSVSNLIKCITFRKQNQWSKSVEELGSINILTSATKDWKSYHKKTINANEDNYGRIMIVYSNESKDVLINNSDAMKVVSENDAKVLSQLKFEKPNTVSVPVLLTRLQAGAGLINVGSVVDVYLNSNYTDENNTNNNSPQISGCTVLSIMRYEENGEIDSEYSKSSMHIKGNTTYPRENTKGFSSNVLELLKGSIIKGYDEAETINMLRDYGIKLSNYERQINLGDLDAQYMLLIEVPEDKVNFMINNMEDIVLTIPTSKAPTWMVDELKYTYTH